MGDRESTCLSLERGTGTCDKASFDTRARRGEGRRQAHHSSHQLAAMLTIEGHRQGVDLWFQPLPSQLPVLPMHDARKSIESGLGPRTRGRRGEGRSHTCAAPSLHPQACVCVRTARMLSARATERHGEEGHGAREQEQASKGRHPGGGCWSSHGCCLSSRCVVIWWRGKEMSTLAG